MHLFRHFNAGMSFVAIIFASAVGQAQAAGPPCYFLSEVGARDHCYADLRGAPTSEEGKVEADAKSLNELQRSAMRRQANEDRTQATHARLRERDARALETFLLVGYQALARQGIAFASPEGSLNEIQAMTLLAGSAYAAPSPMQINYLGPSRLLGKLTTKDDVQYHLKLKGSNEDIQVRGVFADAWREQPCKFTVSFHYLLGDVDRTYPCETFASKLGQNGVSEQIEEALRTLLTPSELPQ